MQPKRRGIRLKEHYQGNTAIWKPSDKTMLCTDGSLPQIVYEHPVTEDGFLDTGVPRSPEKNSVFVLGGSFVESSYSAMDRRFIAQAARRVEANVLNGGYSGMTSLHMLNTLTNKIAGLARPGDSVLLFSPLSNANALLTGGYWTDHPRYAQIQPPYESSPPEWGENTAALLSTMVHFCRQVGLRVALAASPRREEVDFNAEGWLRKLHGRKRQSFERMYEARTKVIEDTRDVASAMEVPLLDMHAALGGKAKYFYDEVHLNHDGQDVAADHLVDFLEDFLAPA